MSEPISVQTFWIHAPLVVYFKVVTLYCETGLFLASQSVFTLVLVTHIHLRCSRFHATAVLLLSDATELYSSCVLSLHY